MCDCYYRMLITVCLLPYAYYPHAASGWRIHCGVEVTELSINKQHSLLLPYVYYRMLITECSRVMQPCQSLDRPAPSITSIDAKSSMPFDFTKPLQNLPITTILKQHSLSLTHIFFI